MSVTQQIHWIQLKRLLLRPMYNLSLLRLCAILLVGPTALTGRLSDLVTLHCTVQCLI